MEEILEFMAAIYKIRYCDKTHLKQKLVPHLQVRFEQVYFFSGSSSMGILSLVEFQENLIFTNNYYYEFRSNSVPLRYRFISICFS